MESWRRQRSDNYNQEGKRVWTRSRKPPLGNWAPTNRTWEKTVPIWEKKFCWQVGRVPWKKILETKNILPMYTNMVKWDDSAAEESFKNAKARYWAGLNRLPCDIPSPDPNAYIDDVDWDYEIDPELILDLDRDYELPDDDDANNKGEPVLIFSDDYLAYRGFFTNGWSDLDANADVAGGGIDHGGQWDTEDKWETYKDKWETACKEGGNGGGDGWNCDTEWKQDNKVEESGNYGDYGGNSDSYRNSSGGGYGNEFGGKFGNYKDRNNNNWGYNGSYRGSNNCGYNGNYGGRGGNMSRYKETRFYSNDKVYNQWETTNRNGRRRNNYAHNQQFSRPVNNNWPAKQGNNRGWEKPVSGGGGGGGGGI